jgi:hypothetical protein
MTQTNIKEMAEGSDDLVMKTLPVETRLGGLSAETVLGVPLRAQRSALGRDRADASAGAEVPPHCEMPQAHRGTSSCRPRTQWREERPGSLGHQRPPSIASDWRLYHLASAPRERKRGAPGAATSPSPSVEGSASSEAASREVFVRPDPHRVHAAPQFLKLRP